jgi:hypothetical protein
MTFIIIVDNVSRPDALAEASAQVTFGISVAWIRGTAVSGTLVCPANVICGLTGAAKYLHVEGTAIMHSCGYDGMTDPNAYPCQYPPSVYPPCTDVQPPNVKLEVPYPFTSVCSLPTELFEKFVLTCS